MVLGDGTEVRRGNIYEQVERIGEVRKRTDVPLQDSCFPNSTLPVLTIIVLTYIIYIV
jgi:hypothetical protein